MKKVKVGERASVMLGGAGRKAQRYSRRGSLENHRTFQASRCTSLRASRTAQLETISKFYKSLEHVLLGQVTSVTQF